MITFIKPKLNNQSDSAYDVEVSENYQLDRCINNVWTSSVWWRIGLLQIFTVAFDK